ncbi:hypothetical protein DAMA08_034480 [Martiniozyma asiatica (nom. inval.)]|nr:hypothetical protein DAMA08_034480 [Martiniozyma asiatica]
MTSQMASYESAPDFHLQDTTVYSDPPSEEYYFQSMSQSCSESTLIDHAGHVKVLDNELQPSQPEHLYHNIPNSNVYYVETNSNSNLNLNSLAKSKEQNTQFSVSQNFREDSTIIDHPIQPLYNTYPYANNHQRHYSYGCISESTKIRRPDYNYVHSRSEPYLFAENANKLRVQYDSAYTTESSHILQWQQQQQQQQQQFNISPGIYTPLHNTWNNEPSQHEIPISLYDNQELSSQCNLSTISDNSIIYLDSHDISTDTIDLENDNKTLEIINGYKQLTTTEIDEEIIKVDFDYKQKLKFMMQDKTFRIEAKAQKKQKNSKRQRFNKILLSCPIADCPYTGLFKTPDYLKRHIREQHGKNSRLHYCSGHINGINWGCGKGFKRLYQLHNHWKGPRSLKKCKVPQKVLQFIEPESVK